MDEVRLDYGERLILKAQGTMQVGLAWQLGHLFLTSRRLVFIHATKTTMECSLDKITEMWMVRRSWMLGVKMKQLCIELKNGSECGHIYIALAKLDELAGMIKESMTRMLAERRGCNEGGSKPPGNA